MNEPIFLSIADQQSLLSLMASDFPGTRPTPDQKSALAEILARVANPSTEESIKDSVSLNDRVSLVCRTDSRDSFDLQIVMPAEADLDENRISVLLPISLAIIGRRRGELVSWDTSHGQREMRITRVSKLEAMTA